MEDVKLHGAWTSLYSYYVIWALKLKGIPFEYTDEDLSKKSDLLLQYNPVHKKIPVLVHGGRPICEWPQHPLVPSDTYERAVARSWVKFAQEKGPNLSLLYRTAGEEQEKIKKNIMEMLTMLEDYGPDKGRKFFGGDNIDIVDIAFGSVAHWMRVIEEVSGVNLFDAEKFTQQRWMESFKKVPIISENSPDHEKLLACLKCRRESLFGSCFAGFILSKNL